MMRGVGGGIVRLLEVLCGVLLVEAAVGGGVAVCFVC